MEDINAQGDAMVLRLMKNYSDIDPNWLEKGEVQLKDGSVFRFCAGEMRMFRSYDEARERQHEVAVSGDDVALCECNETFEVDNLDTSEDGQLVPVEGYFEDPHEWVSRRLDDDEDFPGNHTEVDGLAKEVNDFEDRLPSLESLFSDGTIDCDNLYDVVERIKMFPAQTWNQGVHEEVIVTQDKNGYSDHVAFCIPAGEGKTSLTAMYPDWFIDGDQVVKDFLGGCDLERVHDSSPHIYRLAAHDHLSSEKILLTGSPVLVPAMLRYYAFLLCKCDGNHPHDGHGIVKPHGLFRTGYPGKVWFFHSFYQRNLYVMVLAHLHFYGQYKLVDHFLNGFVKKGWDYAELSALGVVK
jgi:hypothetical protein